MSHNVFGTLFSTHHCVHPFTCPCEENNLIEEHSMGLSQRVFTVALAILIGIPTFGVGGVLTFYLLSAALKSRNVAWHHYCEEYPKYRTKTFWYHPIYWGVPVYWGIPPSRGRNHFHHGRENSYVPVVGRGHSAREGFDPYSNARRRDRSESRRSGFGGSSAAFTHTPYLQRDRGESARFSGLGSDVSSRGFGGRRSNDIDFTISPRSLGGGGMSARSSGSGGFGGGPGTRNVSVGGPRR